MKKYILISFVCCLVGLFSACDYLNVDDYFEDTFKEDSIFSNKNNLEYYYNGAVMGHRTKRILRVGRKRHQSY